MYYGSWWAVQWLWPVGWFSLGIHIEPRHLKDHKGRHYGPYLDFHLVCFIISFGWRPIYAGTLESTVSVSRGGLNASC